MKQRRIYAALFLLFLAPFFGEVLSGSSPPLEIIQPMTLILQLMLYGCGALLIRELAVRKNLNWASIFLIGMAYGIYEEGIVVRSFFDPTWMDLGLLAEYGRSLGVNWIWTFSLTLFHAVMSITLPIMVTYLVFPKQRDEPWLKRGGLIVTGIAFLLMIFLGILFDMKAGWFHLAGSWISIGLLVYFAIKHSSKAEVSPVKKPIKPFWLASTAFILMAGFFLAMWLLPELGFPPVLDGLLILLLIAGEFLLTRRIRDDRSMIAYIAGNVPLWVFFAIISASDPARTDNTTGMTAVGVLTLICFLILRWRTLHRMNILINDNRNLKQ